MCFRCGIKNQGKMGGENRIVGTDESLFTERKSDAGRVLPQRWLLADYDENSGPFFDSNSQQKCINTF